MKRINENHAGMVAERFHRLVAVVSVCAISACAGAPPRAPAHVGTYMLESVDGRPIPADVDGQRIVSGEITLSADGTWALTARNIRQRDAGVRDTTVFLNRGMYTLDGASVTLSSQNTEDKIPGKATLEGATLTSRDDGHISVYRRRLTAR